MSWCSKQIYYIGKLDIKNVFSFSTSKNIIQTSFISGDVSVFRIFLLFLLLRFSIESEKKILSAIWKGNTRLNLQNKYWNKLILQLQACKTNYPFISSKILWKSIDFIKKPILDNELIFYMVTITSISNLKIWIFIGLFGYMRHYVLPITIALLPVQRYHICFVYL